MMMMKDKIKWSRFIAATFIVVTREDVSSSLLPSPSFYVHTRFQEATVG
jgi:hypothetical protein